ncbi:MAG: acetolactate synthase small subunit [Planctomycetota bacterium]
MRHVIACLVENKAGVLAQISGLFSSRGFNIDSLAVGETENPALSRMTIAVHGDDATLEQVKKQLEKVIDVVRVEDLSSTDYVERDLMLVKIQTLRGQRTEILEIASVFRAKVVDLGAKDITLEISGEESKLEALLSLLKPYGVKELVRTGAIAIRRGEKHAHGAVVEATGAPALKRGAQEEKGESADV